MEMKQKFFFTRILRVTMAMLLVLSMLLMCGCGKQDQETEPVDKGLLLGDGDGRLEAQDFVDGTTTIYGNLLSAVTSDYGTGTGTESETTIRLGDQLLSMLSMLIQQNGLSGDIGWLKELGIQTSTTQDGQHMQTSIAAKLNGQTLLSADAILDLAGDMTYIGLPELNGTYLAAETEFSAMYGAYSAMLANLGQHTELLRQLPTEEELNALLTRYLNLMLGVMADPATGTETLTFGELSQTVDTTTYTLSDTAMLDMMVCAVTTATTDAELEKMLDAFSQLANTVGAEQAAKDDTTWENVDLYAELLTHSENVLATLEKNREDMTGEPLLVLVAYTAGEEQVGFALELHNVVVGYEETYNAEVDCTEYVPVYDTVEGKVYSLKNGENTAFVLAVGDAFQITGTGTQINDQANGRYVLETMGTEMLTIEVKNFDTKALKKAELKGTLRLMPSKDFMDQVVGNNMFFGSNLALELTLDVHASGSAIGMDLYNGSALLLGMSTSSRQVAGKQIHMPASFVNVEDEAALKTWVEGMNTDILQQRLLAAGVPEELVTQLLGTMTGKNEF